MKNIILKFLGIAFVLGFTFSCYYDSQEAINPVFNTTCDTVNVTFTKNIKVILSENCLGCHSNSSAASSGGGIKLENYADASAKATSCISDIKSGTMPKNSPKLSNSCINNQYDIWIKNNKPE